jgi:5'(3')-deoxyribonucleotidase
MRPIRVGIDFDSTIAQIAQPWLDLFNARKGTTLTLMDWKDWDLSFLAVDDRPLFFSLLTPELYETVEPYPHAAEVIQRWASRPDLELVCVTSNPSKDSERFTAAKVKWLKRYIPSLAGSVIAARAKSGLGLDVLIDDAPHHHADGDYVSVLVRRPWNENANCDLAFENWTDADDVLGRAVQRFSI